MRRVVVTGIGMVTPLGSGVDHNWSQIIAGKSGIIIFLEVLKIHLAFLFELKDLMQKKVHLKTKYRVQQLTI